MEAAHSDMAAQLCAALAERDAARAALVQAQATAQEWQEAYQGAVEGKAFYMGMFEQATRKAVRV
jgi:hypothetical protein